MAWSWVRVSTRTSPKLRDCLGEDTSSGKIRDCVEAIVAAAGGRMDDLTFEVNGRFARMKFFWENVQVKHAVIFDLEADHVVDVLSGEERSDLQLRGPHP